MNARLIHEIGHRLYLRRFTFGSRTAPACPHSGMTGHDAMVLIGQTPLIQGRIKSDEVWPVSAYKDDPRWPTHCVCGYAFQEADEWQVFNRRHYDTPSGDPEPGDIFWTTWGGQSKDRQKWEEAPHLYGVCPDGRHWDMDGPSTNGNGWTRSGEPPLITASPSIDTGTYHGFLQNGVFSPDLAGRTYPLAR